MIPAVPLPPWLLTLSSEAGDLLHHPPQATCAQPGHAPTGRSLSPPGGGTPDTTHLRLPEVQTRHRSEQQGTPEDPVASPDEQLVRRSPRPALRPRPQVAVLPLWDSHVVLVDRFRHATRTWQWTLLCGAGAEGMAGTDNAAQQLQHHLSAEPLELTGLGEVHTDAGLIAEPVLLYAARINAVGRVAHDSGIRRARILSSAEADQMALASEITDALTLSAIFKARQARLIDDHVGPWAVPESQGHQR